MKTGGDVQPLGVPSGRSLGEVLRDTAYAQLPATFHWLLQACVPLAFQFWAWGWHRLAGWLLVASAFSVWALAQQRLEGHADGGDACSSETPSHGRIWGIARGLAALVALSATLALVLEGFAQLLAAVFKCPGCAG